MRQVAIGKLDAPMHSTVPFGSYRTSLVPWKNQSGVARASGQVHFGSFPKTSVATLTGPANSEHIVSCSGRPMSFAHAL